MLQLVVEEEDRILTFPLAEGEHLVGSAEGSAVRLRHPTVSGRHALLRVTGDECAVEDLGSRNGTRVEGRKVEGRKKARPGARLRFGTQEAGLERIVAADLEPAVRFEAPAPDGGPEATAGPRLTTAGAGSLEAFALESLPAMLDKLEGEASVEDAAQVAAAALYDTLPCLGVEVHAAGGGLIFRAARVEGPPPETVRVENREVTFIVGFAHATQARGFRPLVESAARLTVLTSRRSAPTGRRPAAAEPPPLPDPPTVDPVVRRIYGDAARVARGEISVLISGESGTGKEVLARYLHAASPRAEKPFVALNCAALPSDLLEAELFGVESGVATGVEARPGRFELADGGTLFLDEIGDMAAATQAKILRVLQEGELYRLGGREARPARVRVIAATNRNLAALLETGEFRADLYHRIADWTVELPPLRRRAADIPNLAAFFLTRQAERRGVWLAGISRAAIEALSSHPWPGNVRQLEREMARAALFLDDGQMLQAAHLQEIVRESAGAPPATGGLRERLEAVERREIVATLRTHDGNLSATARELEIARSTLYRRIEELGIDPADPS